MLIRSVIVALTLVIVSACLFGYFLNSQSGFFREFQAALLQEQWLLLICLAVWCGAFVVLSFSSSCLPMIGLLNIAIVAYFIGYASSRELDVLILLAAVTLGKGARLLLNEDGRWRMEDGNGGNFRTANSERRMFLLGVIGILAFASWLHLNMTDSSYHGPRWMGLWNNPNDYGLLMGVGVVLAIGLLLSKLKAENRKQKLVSPHPDPLPSDGRGKNLLRSLRSFAAGWIGERRRRGDESDSGNPESEIGNRKCIGDSLRRLLPIFLFIAAGMMGTGLLFSYSRGAWVGTAIGLLYLAKAYGKFKWRYVLPPIIVAVAVAWFFWNTPRTAPWYFQRLDLSRGSVQHRVAAWKAGFEMMRDHPFGVGWNKTVETYQNNYSPPEDGAVAITTNDYLMLGTQLGIPGLVCFVGYVALCFRGRARHSARAALDGTGGQGTARPTSSPVTRHLSLQTACRAGALVCLVAFWFDGGLFKLATASVFWILLELSQVRNAECGVRNQTDLSLVTSAATK